MRTSDQKVYVGIDMSKDWLDVAVRPSGEVWQETQDEDGISTLVKCLTKLRPELIVMEASGGAERLAATALGAGQLSVAVVNPARFATLLAHRGYWPRQIVLTPQ